MTSNCENYKVAVKSIMCPLCGFITGMVHVLSVCPHFDDYKIVNTEIITFDSEFDKLLFVNKNIIENWILMLDYEYERTIMGIWNFNSKKRFIARLILTKNYLQVNKFALAIQDKLLPQPPFSIHNNSDEIPSRNRKVIRRHPSRKDVFMNSEKINRRNAYFHSKWIWRL